MRVVAGLMSVALHVALLLLITLSGGRHAGIAEDDAPLTRLVMIEQPRVDHRKVSDPGMVRPQAISDDLGAPTGVRSLRPPMPSLPEPGSQTDEADGSEREEILAEHDTGLARVAELPSPITMPQKEAAELVRRVERLARKKLETQSVATATWTKDGRQYDAELVLERSRDGTDADRVIADVVARSDGGRLRTRLMLKRLAYSQFAQIIDTWDPQVQLHDDEVVGTTHINSRFNILSDAEASPALVGKVSTSAVGFNMRSTRRTREADVFREGVETRAGRISLSEQVRPAEWKPQGTDARVHEFARDTRIRFSADGRYYWWDSGVVSFQRVSEPTTQPIYFIAARGVTLYVQGVIAGKVLVYSPESIVVEGNLTCANDPSVDAGSGDYVGLVSDKDIEIARPPVTGPGDLEIQAALFARRRFVIHDFDHRGMATLRIYGSLAAGSMTASEPRYAMRIVFDRRFEDRRPPGFPAMNRFAAENWDLRWNAVPERTAADRF